MPSVYGVMFVSNHSSCIDCCVTKLLEVIMEVHGNQHIAYGVVQDPVEVPCLLPKELALTDANLFKIQPLACDM